ncbi:MAG: biotin transporter BioY [Alphaproteobacteria bacterium HGW-Alphaproteobacteria-6]|nr:MAG: biotin transporter BioY [Alphaproteobacteria bacterium HGW-Alphaproteobacteria-6]
MTLSKAYLPAQSLAIRAAMVLAGSALIGLGAQVSVPMVPVPMSLQTLAILIVGFSYGARLGGLTVLAYLAEGAAGLPVFAGGHAGLAYMAGPTAGFLAGFVAMAVLAGLAADRGIRGPAATTLVALAASAALYLPGLAWPALVMGKAMPDLLSGWMLPFLAGDALKAVIAALIITGAWTVLKARKA